MVASRDVLESLAVAPADVDRLDFVRVVVGPVAAWPLAVQVTGVFPHSDHKRDTARGARLV